MHFLLGKYGNSWVPNPTYWVSGSPASIVLGWTHSQTSRPSNCGVWKEPHQSVSVSHSTPICLSFRRRSLPEAAKMRQHISINVIRVNAWTAPSACKCWLHDENNWGQLAACVRRKRCHRAVPGQADRDTGPPGPETPQAVSQSEHDRKNV